MGVILYRDATGEFVPLSGGGPPIGVITPYAGATAPEGWHLCDGTAHGSAELQAIIGSATTPDLKDRFVVGAGTTMPAKSTGGLVTVTLTGAQTGTPAHNHTATSTGDLAGHTHTYTAASTGGHTHATYYANYVERADLSNTQNSEPAALSNSSAPTKSITTTGAEGGVHAHTGTAGDQTGNHKHSMSIGASVAANATAAHENQPPFYAMVYIIFGG